MQLGRRFGLTSALGAAVAATLAVTAAPQALADTTFLPVPGPNSCALSAIAGVIGTYPADSNWNAFKLTVTSYATITTSQALVAQDPGTQPTKIVFRANDGTVGTASWTEVGTLTQTSYSSVGLNFYANYSGAVSFTPGTYWMSVQGASAAATLLQGVCLHQGSASQSPWSFDYAASPERYATANNGATYTPLTDTAPYIIPIMTLSGIEEAPPEPADPDSLPRPVLQQIPVPAGLSCREVDRPDLNWAGVSSDGWGQSWAQWANDGSGGFVCTRTLAYSSNLRGWTVG